MGITREEVFGPVLSVLSFDDEQLMRLRGPHRNRRDNDMTAVISIHQGYSQLLGRQLGSKRLRPSSKMR
jgi:hypothetical protein